MILATVGLNLVVAYKCLINSNRQVDVIPPQNAFPFYSLCRLFSEHSTVILIPGRYTVLS